MFRFRLERILDIRRQVRERIEAELGDIRNRLREAARRAEELEEERERRIVEFRGRTSFTLDEFRMFHGYVDGLTARIREQRREVARLEREMEAKIGELMEARKNERIMERLREKEWDRYRREAARRETLMLDEVAVRRYVDAQSPE